MTLRRAAGYSAALMVKPGPHDASPQRGPGRAGLGDTAWLFLMSAMLFVLLLPISSYVAALSLIREEWGLNNTQAGAIYSAYLAGYVLSALFVVPLTDRVGPTRILIASAALSTGAHVLFPLAAEGVVSAVLLRATAGAGLVGLYMPGLRLIAERFDGNRRGAAMGLYVTAQYAANSVSLALTGLLMSGLEWRDAYLYVSAAAAAGLPLAVVLLRGKTLRATSGAKGRLDLSVFRNSAASYLILGYALHALQLFAARVWLPVFLVGVLVGRGMRASDAAVEGATLGGLALMAGSVGPLMGGVISDRWGRAVSASAIFALSGGCAWIIGWTAGLPLPLIVGLSTVYGWAIAADSAVYSTGIVEVTPPANLGSTMAVQASVGLIGGAAGPVMFGGILDLAPAHLEWAAAFSALGLLAVVAIVAMQRLRRLPPQTLLVAQGASPPGPDTTAGSMNNDDSHSEER